MLPGWLALIAALLYLLALFGIAHYGDNRGRRFVNGPLRPTIYALTLAVYCTSWTFLGSVGIASRSGLDFLPIYIGPLVVILFALPLIARIVEIAKAQRITSVADFIGSRYGKSGPVAALVAIVAIVATIPYIALQLKAISSSLELIVFHELGYVPSFGALSFVSDSAVLVAIVLTVFAILFGTRFVDATEHQSGLMLAVATESLVKLVAFVLVGLFVVYGMFDGFGDLLLKTRQVPETETVFASPPDPTTWLTTALLAGFAILLLPRQFHVMVVENRDTRDLRAAAWHFPLYLVAINVFVLPIAMAGLIIFPEHGVDRDFMVLSLPMAGRSGVITLIAFIGALSAATAMVIVESVACAIMVSNDLAIPLLLRRPNLRPKDYVDKVPRPVSSATPDMAQAVLTIRRIALGLILLLALLYYRSSGKTTLAAIGLLSFAAIAQLVPPFLIGLFWQRANAQGAFFGLLSGFCVWGYLMFLPTLANEGGALALVLAEGPFGITALSHKVLLDTGMTPLVTGVAYSLGVNIAVFVALSLLRKPTPLERLQANLFTTPGSNPTGPGFALWRSSVSVDDLRNTIARYLGTDRTGRAFDVFQQQRGLTFVAGQEADAHTIRFAEHLLASAIGTASSRLVLSLMLRRRNVSTEAALKLLDDASAAIQYSRTLLQHGLDHAAQGVTVFDSELRLMCWNRAFQDLFQLPPDMMRFGIGLDEIVNFNAERGFYGKVAASDVIAQRISALARSNEPHRLKVHPSGRVIEIHSNSLPDGGLVTTYADVTEAVRAEKALADANATLEKRVKTRTEELTQANRDLAKAKLDAEEANASKTRFLAAASHDIIQPLNAARLYSTALTDALGESSHAQLASNVESSLNAVEEILSALLEISRLDAGKMPAEISAFPIADLFSALEIEFGPVAKAKGIRLTFMPSKLVVSSDRRLLRRLLQNLVSNAIKYTVKGRVLVGAKRKGNALELVVGDTGIGIPATKHKAIFREFQRLEQGARIERGLGLGLSIVERIARVLEMNIELQSRPGKGSIFHVEVPCAPEAAARALAEQAEGQRSVAFSPLNGLAVLVIDNEPTILDGMTRMLEGWGCTVIAAKDSTEAMAAIKAAKLRPDVALVDFQLDHGNGIEAIKKLRWRLRKELPAALVTADRSPEVRDRAEAEEILLLNKPVKPAALRALLTQLSLSVDVAE